MAVAWPVERRAVVALDAVRGDAGRKVGCLVPMSACFVRLCLGEICLPSRDGPAENNAAVPGPVSDCGGLAPLRMLNQCIGPYRVLRLLGEGGMGMVYEAVRDDIGVRAAVKVLRPEYARIPDLAARFFNEARAANMIQHPGIVRIFDYGQIPTGEAYLAMEYLEGELLRIRLQREVRLTEPDAMRLARQVASAVASAHGKNIVHRDLKPENIMLVSDAEAPGGERAKVLDFGIAKLDSMSGGFVRTRTNTVMGTPAYMAPEQCRGIKSIGDRVDVYALGVMLFEMLAGRTPFVAEAPGDLIGMHMYAPPPLLSTYLPHCDSSLARLVASMLQKDPATRPSMNDVAQTLKALGNLVSDVMPMRILAEQDASTVRVDAAVRAALRAGPAPGPAAAPPPAPSRNEQETALRGREAGAAQATAKVPHRADAEPTLPVREPPTMPMRSSDLAALASARGPTDRAGAAHAGAAGASRPRGGDDSTELMSEGRIAAVSRSDRGELPAIPPEAEETAPIILPRDLPESEEVYRSRRGRSTSKDPLTQVAGWVLRFLQLRSPGASGAHSLLNKDQDSRKGLLIFGTLVFVGLLLGLMILLAI